MTTQMLEAKMGKITPEMQQVAKEENVSPELIRDGVKSGRIVILKNPIRPNSNPIAIGENLKVKINANINTTGKRSNTESELDKVRVIAQAGADVIMDLSTNKLIDETRKAVLATSNLPVGTVPMIQAGVEALNQYGDISAMDKDLIFSLVERHCMDGADFVCLHCALTKNILAQLERQKRLSRIVSHGATMLACWMKSTNQENPLYQHFSELLSILKRYNVVLLLGSALKSGSTSDASDGVEVAEAIIIGELVKKAREANVQVMVEGLEQVSLNKIPFMVQNIKELTDFAPLYTSGAIACDSAVGYDNITSAIGSALAAYQGADMLKATTSVDRIGFSHPAHIREGIMSAKIAAHCADLARGNVDAMKNNYKISFARMNENWQKQLENSLDKAVFDGMNEIDDANFGTYCSGYSMADLYDKYFSK